MSRPDPHSPRPGKATSWEEFRAGSAAERAAWGPSRSPTKARSQAALGVVFGFGALVFLAGAVVAAGLGMWVLIVLAVFCGWVAGRYLPTAVRQGAFGTPRYWKMVLLRAMWRARVAGQQARTTAGHARTTAGHARAPARRERHGLDA
jgi:hypothetical protein